MTTSCPALNTGSLRSPHTSQQKGAACFEGHAAVVTYRRYNCGAPITLVLSTY